jgi:PilZ domain
MFDCYNPSMQRIPHIAELAGRRDAPRTDLDGRYSMRLDPCDGRGPINCALLDFSVTGVRLQLPEDVELPAEVPVLVGELAHDARIVWRNGTTVGVDFIDEHHSIF